MKKSKEFFTKIGFKPNPQHPANDDSASFLIGSKNVVLMLFPEPVFKHFTSNEIADTKHGTEVLFSIDAETREEVNELTHKAEKAGGRVFGKPSEIQGWMYGSGFTDLDGHRWNVLHMDLSKMPK